MSGFVWGYDISDVGDVDPTSIAADGAAFALIQTGDGLGEAFANSRAAAYVKRARALGLKVGFYHCNRPRRLREGKVAEEVAWMKTLVDRAGGLFPGDFRIIIDVEKSADEDAVDIPAFVRALRTEVRRVFGHDPIFYSGKAFIEAHLSSARDLADLTLWMAQYPRPALNRQSAERRFPNAAPGVFPKVHMWQYDGDVTTQPGFLKIDFNLAPTLDGMLIEPTRLRTQQMEEGVLIYAADGSIWLLTGGKSHRFALPADVTKLKNQGVPDAGEMSLAFHNMFEHVG
jgi:GH25 family lysozyme M1 (1,4-beta-N-acetylmuramidase)